MALLATLTKATSTLASATATSSVVFVSTYSVTAMGQTYVVQATIATTANTVLLGSSDNATLTNLQKAIMNTGTSGTTYGSLTVAHPDMTATIDACAQMTITMTSRLGGTFLNGLKNTSSVSTGVTNTAWASGAGSLTTAIATMVSQNQLNSDTIANLAAITTNQ